MPVAHIHLTNCTPDQERRLLVEGSERYAAVMSAPVELVRIFIHHLATSSVAVGGRPVADSGDQAAYFEAIAMKGRPIETRHGLLAEFTDLLVDVLGIERDLVRGMVVEVEPDHWGIAGIPASRKRAGEIAARAGADKGQER